MVAEQKHTVLMLVTTLEKKRYETVLENLRIPRAVERFKIGGGGGMLVVMHARKSLRLASGGTIGVGE
jgi:hypothetical protein